MDRKKILAWVLCAAMLLTLGLSGCGKDKDPNSTPSGDPSAPSSSVVGPSGSDVSDPTDPTVTGDATQGGSDATQPNSSGSDKTTAGGNKTTAGGNKTTSANNNNDNNKPSNDTDAIGKTGYINVAELGVKGDGKTDNTGRFQEIIDALKTGSNTITFFFPAGTYLFKSTVYLPTFTNIVGEPAASGVGGATVIKAAGRMSCVFTHKDNGYFHGNVFMNLTCDGNSGKYKVDSFFYMGSVLGSSFFNMKFQNISGNGIETVKVTQNPYDWVNRFHFMEFTNVGGYAIDTTVTDTYYSDIHVKGGKGIRDTIHGGSVYRNVTVENSTGNGLSLGRSGVGEVANTVVINCTFKNNAGYGLYLAAGSKVINKQTAVSACEMSGNKSGDIYAAKNAETAIRGNDLRSSKAIVTDNVSTGLAVVDNASAAAISLSGSGHAVNGNKVGSYLDGCGAKSGKNDFPALYKSLGAKKVVSVADYGAAANGTTNDGPAFNKAIAALSGGGTLIVPRGTYAIGTTVNIPSNITVYAEGTSYLPLAGVGTMFRIKNASGVTLYDMAFKNDKNVPVASFVSFESSKNCDLVRCSVTQGKNTSKAAIAIDSGCTAVNIRHGSFNSPEKSGSNTLVLCSGSGTEIHDTYFSHGVIAIHFNGGKNNKVYAVHCDWFTQTAIKFSGSTTGNTVEGCYFDINDIAVTADYASSTNAALKILSCTFRADGQLVSAGQLPPVIHLKNTVGVDILGNAFEHAKPVLLEGSNKTVRIYGNSTCGAMISGGDTSGCTIEHNGVRG